MDDILIFSRTFSEHLYHTEYVLKKIQEIGFTIKVEKTKLFKQKIDYLGFEIENGQLCIPLKQKMKSL